MSQINVDNVAGLVPRETVIPDRGRVHGQAPGAEPFGNHFWRIQGLPKETVPAGQPDSARLSQPPAAPPDAPQPFTQEREPAADDPRSDPRDSADVDADEDAAGRVAAEAASEDNRAETAQTQSDIDDGQPSETAEPASQTQHGEETDANPGANEAKQVDPHQAPAKPSPHQPNGHVGTGVVGQPASARTSTDRAEKGRNTPQHAASKEQAAEATPPAQTLSDHSANQADASLQRLVRQNAAAAISGAAASAQPADKTAGQPTDNPDSRGRSAKKAAEVDKPPGTLRVRQQNSPTQVSQPGAPLPAPLQGAKEDTPSEQVGRHGKQQPGNAAVAAAAASRADAHAAANQPATSEDERTSGAGDPKLQAPHDPAKPPPTAVPDNRLNAPLRISPSQDSRVAPTQPPHQSGESVDGDRARFVQRVARAFQAVGKSNGSIRLRLSPPELGSLRLEITVRNGLLTARVEAETPTARNLLLDNLPALRDRLAQQDIKIKQFDVALMDRSPGGSPEQMADQTHSHRQSGGHTAPQPANHADRDTKPASAFGGVNRPGEGTQLNVVI